MSITSGSPCEKKIDLATVTDQPAVPHLTDSTYADPTIDSLQHTGIYIDPKQEAAVLRKFDKYLLPQAFIIILLNYLDRSNLGTHLPYQSQSLIEMSLTAQATLEHLDLMRTLVLLETSSAISLPCSLSPTSCSKSRG